MTENIDEIKRKAIAEIKEKVKKNPGPSGYSNPCNRERLEDMKRLMFVSGNEFVRWMQRNGIMKSPTNVKRKDMKKIIENAGCKTITEYHDKCAQKAGFKNAAERSREWRHEKGICEPVEFNEECNSNFGVSKGEELFKIFLEEVIFEYVEKTGYHDGEIDFKCKNLRQEFMDKYPQFKLEKNKEYKFQLKNRCPNQTRLLFPIRYNKTADYFILVEWDNRNNLNPLHIWIFNRNKIVRERPFWMRESFTMSNKPSYRLQFQEYELKNEIGKLREIIYRLKDIEEF